MTTTIQDPDLRRDCLDSRTENVRRYLRDLGAACLVTTTPESFAYSTGCWISTFHWLASRRVYSVITHDSSFVVASTTQSKELTEAGVVQDIAEYAGDSQLPEDVLFRELKSRNLHREPIAVEWEGASPNLKASVNSFHAAVDCSDSLLELRATKDDLEISELRAAAEAVANASEVAAAGTRAGDTELDLARRISDYALSRGALDGFLVVTSGPRTALTHGVPTRRQLVAGDVVRVDIIRRAASGYLGDIAQTMFVGEPTARQSYVLNTVDDAVAAATRALRPGELLGAAYNAAATAARISGIDMSFGHVGHSIGLALHEPPMITQESVAVCRPGMVFCVEVILGDGGAWYHLERLVHVQAEGSHVIAGAGNDPLIIRN